MGTWQASLPVCHAPVTLTLCSAPLQSPAGPKLNWHPCFFSARCVQDNPLFQARKEREKTKLEAEKAAARAKAKKK